MTPNPDGPWMAQVARNICMWLAEEGKKVSYLIRDGDKKITKQFDSIIESTGATVKKTPRRSPCMNPFAESWVASIKRECLNRFVALGRHHLEYLVNSYVSYYNSKRPHRGIGNVPIGVGEAPAPEETEMRDGVACEVWLGGVLKHYRRAA